MTRLIAVLRTLILACVVSASGLCTSIASANDTQLVEQNITLGSQVVNVRIPAGFELTLLTTALSGPRVIHQHNDELFIGSKSGAVYWLKAPYIQPTELAQLKDYPHSVVVHENYLYVAHTSGVVRTPWPTAVNADQLPLRNKHFEKVVDVPGGGGHNSRTLKLGPDNRLYISLGITGNCSNEFLDASFPWNDRRGGFFTVEAKNGTSESDFRLVPFASGLRNPVGFDWHPKTDVLYASNNGPDHSGYEFPRESFAKVTQRSFHGMPWFQWNDNQLMQDPCINTPAPLSGEAVVAPVATFPARIAPMDVGFVDSTVQAWQAFNHDAIVALHGSWATSDGGGRGDPSSRREPMIVRVEFNEQGVATGAVHSLVEGFQLEDGQRWARPMGIAFNSDGSLFFTSDGGIEGLFRLQAVNTTK